MRSSTRVGSSSGWARRVDGGTPRASRKRRVSRIPPSPSPSWWAKSTSARPAPVMTSMRRGWATATERRRACRPHPGRAPPRRGSGRRRAGDRRGARAACRGRGWRRSRHGAAGGAGPGAGRGGGSRSDRRARAARCRGARRRRRRRTPSGGERRHLDDDARLGGLALGVLGGEGGGVSLAAARRQRQLGEVQAWPRSSNRRVRALAERDVGRRAARPRAAAPEAGRRRSPGPPDRRGRPTGSRWRAARPRRSPAGWPGHPASRRRAVRARSSGRRRPPVAAIATRWPARLRRAPRQPHHVAQSCRKSAITCTPGSSGGAPGRCCVSSSTLTICRIVAEETRCSCPARCRTRR